MQNFKTTVAVGNQVLGRGFSEPLALQVFLGWVKD